MSTSFSVSHTAFLFCDIQNFILSRFPADRRDTFIASIVRLHHSLQGIRDTQDSLVVHVAALFRPGHPEIVGRGEYGSILKTMNLLVENTEGAAFPEGLKATETDLIVRKIRVGAFQGSELHTILQARKIEHVVVFGATTYGVVLSTVVQAVDLDYKVSVIEDCCIEDNAELNAMLMGTKFGRQVNVVKLDDVLKALEGLTV